jgi:site-specific recombinase XerD
MQTLKGKRDGALLAILLGCGLRRRELIELDFGQPRRTAGNGAIAQSLSRRDVRLHEKLAGLISAEGKGLSFCAF